MEAVKPCLSVLRPARLMKWTAELRRGKRNREGIYSRCRGARALSLSLILYLLYKRDEGKTFLKGNLKWTRKRCFIHTDAFSNLISFGCDGLDRLILLSSNGSLFLLLLRKNKGYKGDNLKGNSAHSKEYEIIRFLFFSRLKCDQNLLKLTRNHWNLIERKRLHSTISHRFKPRAQMLPEILQWDVCSDLSLPSSLQETRRGKKKKPSHSFYLYLKLK